MEELGKEADVLYNKLTFTPLAEIISGEFKTKGLDKRLHDMTMKLDTLYNLGYAELDKIPSDDLDRGGYDFDLELDDINGKILSKLEVVSEIVDILDDMRSKSEGDDWLSVFADIKKREI
jgi:hypothetical protein